MQTTISKTHQVRCHATWAHFDYQLAVDWAIDLIRSGTESENLLILASLVPRVDSYEASKYTSAALRDLGLAEYNFDDGVRVRIQLHLEGIIRDVEIKKHVYDLKDLARDLNLREDIKPFFYLHYAWEDAEDNGLTEAGRFVDEAKQEARAWMEKHAISVDD